MWGQREACGYVPQGAVQEQGPQGRGGRGTAKGGRQHAARLRILIAGAKADFNCCLTTGLLLMSHTHRCGMEAGLWWSYTGNSWLRAARAHVRAAQARTQKAPDRQLRV